MMSQNKPTLNTAHGMESFDVGKVVDNRQDNRCIGALDKEQQAKLNRFKIQTRSDNERYLESHPEVECMLGVFLSEIMVRRPENIRDFAADYFTRQSLNQDVETKMKEKNGMIKFNKVLKEMSI